jgi:hypothetical protein
VRTPARGFSGTLKAKRRQGIDFSVDLLDTAFERSKRIFGADFAGF